ncbi:helix-turn-helix transcriptional regulator [Labrys sp. KNU-23]|uniref:helix-turn-helix domain-containing protein n=1 Tax=Labrys sp. KNU-23 TaxID=2789216 RepID=UPI0011EE398C|nr:helix-turn-helix transcriptional regulator [Labrys sp. KNU-23]QEN86752.1 helix-turn-helix transcriptional regulator [Labrys sp. KNU-23]
MAKSLYTQRHLMIAAAIGAQRRAKGLTQADVAKAMGGTWSQPIIVNIEKGGRRLDLVELLRLADIIELDIEALIRKLREVPDE